MYLDPSSGSILVQAVIGGVVGLGAILRLYWGKIRAFGKRGSSSAGAS
jgi:hypothetical protein